MPPKLVPDLQEARRFLDLFGEGLMHRFQVFSDKKKIYVEPWHEEGDLDDLAPRLTASNNSHGGVYFTVNETQGGREREHVTCIRALFADLDKAPLEPVLACGLEPHAIIVSSPGKWHVYWLVGHCPIDRFDPLQLAIAARFNGDTQVSDPSRVMRVPGFYNVKNNPQQVTIFEINHNLRPYTVDELVDGLQLNEGSAVQRNKLPPLSDLYASKIQEGDRHKKLVRYAAKFAYEGKTQDEIYGLVQGINHVCCVAPKPEKEIRDIVAYALRCAGPPVDLSGFLDAHTEDDDAATELALPEVLLTGCPGLVGKTMEWIDSTISRHQPHFAFAVALAFVGVLKGHRVQTPRRGRTNHMTLAIGKSGSGKSDVAKRLDLLIKMAGLDSIAMGTPASDSALRTALSSRGGRAYLFWDEMGLALERMLSKNAPFHSAGIKDLMVELWTCSDTVLRRKELATPESQKYHVDIDQPCFGMYGNAQPDIFYGALSGAHAADGFYPRLLVFETPCNYPPERPVSLVPPADSLIDLCREIDSWPTNSRPMDGNLTSLIIDPRIVPISPGAQKLFDAAKSDVERKLTRFSDSLTSGIYARSLSHMEKIALTVEDGPVISRDAAEWSIDLVTRLSASMSAAFKLRVSDSAIERTKKRVLQVIAAAGAHGVNTHILTRKTQFLRDRRERDAVLSELQSSGQVAVVEETTSGRTAKKWMLTAHATSQESNAVSPFVNFRQSSD